MKNKSFSSLAIACLLLSGCSGSSQTNGAVMGSLTGGLIGSAFGNGSGKAVAVGVGAVMGAFIGSSIGDKMDDTDQEMGAHAVATALASPVGDTVVWSNPDTNHRGTARTVSEYVNDQGQTCREIEQELVIDGQNVRVMMDFHQDHNGQWSTVS